MGSHLSLFKCRTRDTGLFVSRNNDSMCRTSHLSLGITILSVESEIGVIVSNDSKCRTREMGGHCL